MPDNNGVPVTRSSSTTRNGTVFKPPVLR